MNTIYFNVLFHISTELSTKYIFNFASKKLFFLAKKLIFKFCLLLSRGITGGMKTFYFYVLSRFSTELSTKTPKIRFASKIFFSGKKFDFQILLITFKRHHRRYGNRLFYRSIPSQYRIIYKNIQFSFC